MVEIHSLPSVKPLTRGDETDKSPLVMVIKSVSMVDWVNLWVISTLIELLLYGETSKTLKAMISYQSLIKANDKGFCVGAQELARLKPGKSSNNSIFLTY